MAASIEKLDDWRRDALEQLADERAVSRASLELWWWFHMCLYADLAQHQWELRGYSVRLSEDDCLLTLRIVEDGVPYVVFTGSANTTLCIKKLRRQMRDGTVQVHDDRFA